jgi:seryl-tRNA synthetase
MLDLRSLMEDPEGTLQRLSTRGPIAGLERVLELARQRKQKITEAQAVRQKQKAAGDEIKNLPPEKAAELREQLRGFSQRYKQLETEVKQAEEELEQLLLYLPNIPHASVPAGKDETENRELRRVGEQPAFDFAPLPHWDIGERLGILDFEAGARLSGSRFSVLRGAAARLERALINFMLDLHTSRHGYTEVWTPYLVKREIMQGTGQLPKFENEAFRTAEPEFFLIPTAEVPVTNLHREQILEGDKLPLKYVCYTACFRREAGAAGKDTRGLIRQHQFDKVELVQFARPEDSYRVLEELTGHAEQVLRELGLAYRVIALCSGDLGFSAAKTYDIEVWMPGQNCYREISSCSNFEDFQARRAGIRFRREKGARPELVHTLNGSGLAVGRTLAALLENYQRSDGSVVVPRALVPYTGFEVITTPSR